MFAADNFADGSGGDDDDSNLESGFSLHKHVFQCNDERKIAAQARTIWNMTFHSAKAQLWCACTNEMCKWFLFTAAAK